MSDDQAWAPMLLIVEDDLAIGELIMLRLRTAGYRTTWARTGAQALTKIYEIQPRLMMLDLGLPVIDGFGVLERIRTQRFFKTLPIVVMTASHAAGDVKRALALGADGYLTKPFEAVDMLKRIEKLLVAGVARRMTPALPPIAVEPEPEPIMVPAAWAAPAASKPEPADDQDFLLL